MAAVVLIAGERVNGQATKLEAFTVVFFMGFRRKRGKNVGRAARCIETWTFALGAAEPVSKNE